MSAKLLVAQTLGGKIGAFNVVVVIMVVVVVVVIVVRVDLVSTRFFCFKVDRRARQDKRALCCDAISKSCSYGSLSLCDCRLVLMAHCV